jgi:hypothetical protein
MGIDINNLEHRFDLDGTKIGVLYTKTNCSKSIDSGFCSRNFGYCSQSGAFVKLFGVCFDKGQ